MMTTVPESDNASQNNGVRIVFRFSKNRSRQPRAAISNSQCGNAKITAMNRLRTLTIPTMSRCFTNSISASARDRANDFVRLHHDHPFRSTSSIWLELFRFEDKCFSQKGVGASRSRVVRELPVLNLDGPFPLFRARPRAERHHQIV